MSDLQIGLLGAGAVAIAAVYLFNTWQERQFRRKAEQAFSREHDDVLMRDDVDRAEVDQSEFTPEVSVRIEPRLDAREPTPPAWTPPSAGIANRKLPPLIDVAIDYVIDVTPAAPDTGAELHHELSILTAGWQKPVLVEGSQDDRGLWQPAGVGNGTHFPHMRCAVQISNRAGCISQSELVLFRDAVLKWAERTGADAMPGDIADAQQMAYALDAFCGDVDIAIGINVISREDSPFFANRIRGLAEAAGLKLEADGIFNYRDPNSAPLFTLDNHEPMPFVPEQMSTLQTHGVTFLLDLPRVTNGVQAFDIMLKAARDFAVALDGTLVDDNRTPLSETAIDKIRRQLLAILEKMKAANVPAGSARALRLFS